jgi:type IV secretory pathway TrbD component
MRRRRDLILVNLVVLLMLLVVLLIGWWEAAAFGLGVLVVLDLLVVLRERQARFDPDLDTNGGEAT